MAVLALCLPASAESAARTIPVQVDGAALEGKAYLDGGVTYSRLNLWGTKETIQFYLPLTGEEELVFRVYNNYELRTGTDG